MKKIGAMLVGICAVMLMLVVGSEAATQQAKVSWPDVVTQESGYTINIKIGPSGTYTLAGKVAANVLTFTIPNLTQGTNYCFQVIANSPSGSAFDGDPSDDACVVTVGKQGKVGPISVIIELIP